MMGELEVMARNREDMNEETRRPSASTFMPRAQRIAASPTNFESGRPKPPNCVEDL